MIFLYLVHNEIYIINIQLVSNYIAVTNMLIYGSFCFVVGWLSLYYIKYSMSKLTKDDLIVSKIYPAYTDYMPIYLAICVIAFELNKINDNNYVTILIITLFIFKVFHISNVFYLNPAWYILGKRIFKVEDEKGNYILIISKNDNCKGLAKVDNIKKIDEYVFYKPKEK